MTCQSEGMVIVRDDGFHDDDLVTCEYLSPETLLAGVEWPVCLDIDSTQNPDILVASFCWIFAISIPFPDFTDGRGFSLATRLRQLGYDGRLRATGHLIADQYRLARQSGFDEVAIHPWMAERQPEHQWTAQAGRTVRSYQRRLLRAG